IQAQCLEVKTEIVFIDDASNDAFRKYNKELCKGVRYIQLDKNIGRAAIRNLFLQYASHDYLLFLDCDSLIYNDDFLSNYIRAVKSYPNNVICGGRVYENETPSRDKMLRWKYGIKRESKPVDIRAQHPSASFMTNNFVISKENFEAVKFDERLDEYGHEDTLFGYELKKNGIEIIHIDNPILNGDIESNVAFLRNTEKAINNLTYLLKYSNYDSDLINDVTLLSLYYKLFKIRQLIFFCFLIVKPFIRYLLTKGYINLHLFDFYKIGFFIGIMNKSKSSQS
ncbi:MAG: glycosyltransferase family 2 protein, partial [Candidatus Delongbacteria bacterium]|nr:glycosyltransferase family 2 protein [Candidatus Delongbacteria bacterium]